MNCKFILALILILGTNLAPNSPDSKQSILEEVVRESLEHKSVIEASVEHLAQLINNKAVSVKKPEEAISWLLGMRDTLVSVRSVDFTYISEENVTLFIKLNKSCIEAIYKAIRTNFSELVNIEPDKVLLSIEEIIAETNKNAYLATQLHGVVDNAGLGNINLFYRKLERINSEYRLLPRLTKTGLFCAASALVIYTLPRELINKNSKMLAIIKDKVGSAPIINNLTNEISNKNDIRMIAHLDKLVINLVGKGIPAICAAYTWNKLTSADYLKMFCDGLKNDFRIIHHILRGSYLRKSDKNKTKINLDDIVGCDDAKKIFDDIINYLSSPDKYDRSATDPGKGILFYGPPGTGKTFAVKALASEIRNKIGKCAFKEVTWWDLMNKSVKGVLNEAKEMAPCVVFIDEIDALQLQRDNAAQWSNFLTEFLTGMSGLNSNSDGNNQVIFVAATNKIEHLDHALLRYGRFGQIVYFDRPHSEYRRQYLIKMMNKFAINKDRIDINELVNDTDGCSYTDLEEIIKDAQFNAKSSNKPISHTHFQESIDKKIRKLGSAKNLSESEISTIAAHQAGHALTYMLLDPDEKLGRVTILPVFKKIKEHYMFGKQDNNKQQRKKKKFGQIFTHKDNEKIDIESTVEKAKKCQIILAGYLSEKLIRGSNGNYHVKDKNKAYNKAKEIVFQGLIESELPKEVAEHKKQEAYDLLNRYETDTVKLLENNKDKLKIVYEQLKSKNTLTAAEIRIILD